MCTINTRSHNPHHIITSSNMLRQHARWKDLFILFLFRVSKYSALKKNNIRWVIWKLEQLVDPLGRYYYRWRRTNVTTWCSRFCVYHLFIFIRRGRIKWLSILKKRMFHFLRDPYVQIIDRSRHNIRRYEKYFVVPVVWWHLKWVQTGGCKINKFKQIKIKNFE